MSLFVERIIIKNRAPFESVDLTFKDQSISVLTAFNGKGKTTILSYIVDAWVELTKGIYSKTFEGRENSYYRVSSPLYDIMRGMPSLVYIRFKNNDSNIDYLDSRNGGTIEWYEETVPMADRIKYSEIKSNIEKGKAFKQVSHSYTKEEAIRSIFDYNLCTYFPSYRFELPNFLNEVFQCDILHKLNAEYNGYLNNPLEVTSDIQNIANWILDVVLDQEVNTQEVTLPNGKTAKIAAPEQAIWINTKKVLECALISKFPNRNVRFGIGRRNNSGSRLSIMEIVKDGNDRQYCPTLFSLSSGELSIIAIFAEILRQGDVTFGMIPMEQFHGIVLIDEVDKHLHIQLQKEVLPLLFNLFPNIQFIISSHSPFLNMGLADVSLDRTVIYDLDNNGIESNATTNKVYENAYMSFLQEKNKYAEMYHQLAVEIEQNTKPLIITEGKTDAKHLKAALSRLGITDINVDFFDPSSLQWGDSQLKSMLNHLCKVKQARRIIGMFDRDSEEYINYTSNDGYLYKNLGNNVYVFAIPLVNDSEYGDKISIEHYYSRKDIQVLDDNGRRLFLGDEFYTSGNSKDGRYQTKISKIQNKVLVNGIIDEKVYETSDLEQKISVARTKDSFAEDILNNIEYTRNIDFTNFNKIFDVIRQIIAIA